MQNAYRWVWERPSKTIILALLLTFIALAIPTCSAIESQNKTLSEVSSYNFTDGFYQVVKYKQDSESQYRIIHETEIPYLNITYTAPADGFLDIYLKPIDGPFPYIELDKYWEINSLTYSRSLEYHKTVSFLITPPLIFTDYNSSRAIGMGTTLWELYTWSELSGLINYTFTSTDEIFLEIIWYPSSPRQGDKISLFTQSNADIHNTTWEITGNDLDWVNHSEVIEIDNLAQGTYSIRVSGLDEFNISHNAEAVITVKPPVVEQQYFDISLFSIDHPESVKIGEIIPLSAVIDYSIPTSTEVKWILSNPANTINYTDSVFSLYGNGSSNVNHYIESEESGVMEFNSRLFYNHDGAWVELKDSKRAFSVTVTEPVESSQMPGFNPLSILLGITLVTLSMFGVKKLNE